MFWWRRARPWVRGSRWFESDIVADPVASPTIRADEGLTSVTIETDDGHLVRLTFEKLDSIRLSRGEYPPYKNPPRTSASEWIMVHSDSSWLRERHAYEAKHYRGRYEFGGNADEMLRDFSHYVFHFHDEFIEAIAGGIWFDDEFVDRAGSAIRDFYPLADLDADARVERFEAHGLTMQVRRPPRTAEQIVRDSRLCSQPIAHFALELDGDPSVDWRLLARYRCGRLTSILCDHFNERATFQGLAQVEDAYPYLQRYMEEVAARRCEGTE